MKIKIDFPILRLKTAEKIQIFIKNRPKFVPIFMGKIGNLSMGNGERNFGIFPIFPIMLFPGDNPYFQPQKKMSKKGVQNTNG